MSQAFVQVTVSGPSFEIETASGSGAGIMQKNGAFPDPIAR